MILILAVVRGSAGPVYLENQFELPSGFRIYKAAERELCGGSYDIAFDGEGRLLVGDGRAVRRLRDNDGDGVYDAFEVIAEGLGGRGPQGLLVYGDRLYAVGGDGVQLFEGYEGGGSLTHKGRIGETFNTGGDHAAHTILRGHDGHLYFVTGDGGGTSERMHITEETSPRLYERAASVFRISPDGTRWECISSGGRNAPSLGMNYLGDLFSWDSDMEWHVDLPWYRPLRLNHWVQGGDQGWQGVGAYPPYYIDVLPSVMDSGRGSPTWGVFYEHNQFPLDYRDAFVVCDYRWKSATTGGYDTAGRLVAFRLKPSGAGWEASMEVMVRPRPGALDANGAPVNFALVDVEVAPDGSLFISDHNQGVWRLIYDPGRRYQERGPSVVPDLKPLPAARMRMLDMALGVPQLGSEWSRLRIEQIRARLGAEYEDLLQRAALTARWTVPERIQAVRLLAPSFERLGGEFLQKLARTKAPELRGQAAWLLGLRSKGESDPLLLELLADTDPFVRRRAAEALTRSSDAGAVRSLLERLSDPSRAVQYAAMNALSHRPMDGWLEAGLGSDAAVAVMRTLVAAHLRRETVSETALKGAVGRLIDETGLVRSERLDLLRVLGIFRERLAGDEGLRGRVRDHLLERFPDGDRETRWEQVRLVGEYGFGEGFGALLGQLETEKDPVTQFHIAQAISKLEGGWTREEALRLKRWFLTTQRGWFARLDGKGRQFPEFWGTVLAEYASRHRAVLAEDLSGIDLGGALGGAVLGAMAETPEGGAALMAVFATLTDEMIRRRIIGVLGNIREPEVAAFLRREYGQATDDRTRAEILNSVTKMPREGANEALLVQGLGHPSDETVVNCGRALMAYRPELDRSMADHLMRQLARETELTSRLSTVLMGLSKVRPRPRFSEGTERREIVEYWKGWYEKQFGASFVVEAGAVEMKPNEALYDFINSDRVVGGDAKRGKEVFVAAQCATCHGGAGGTEVLFGPDLAGVTRRLMRRELAEAMVYPSRQVAERFRATEVELKDGEPLSGFITEQNDDSVTLALRDRVQRIARTEIESITPRELSLMPEGVLGALSWDQIRDLFAYLESLGAGGE